MKKQFILLTFLLLNLNVLCFAQQFTGRIIDVMDGRTVVIESEDKTKFAVQLQFIEVPPDNTSFAGIGKEHLKKLSVDKAATYSIRKIVEKKNIGKVLVGGVDLSQQLLLDGAAWYSEPEKGEQYFQEREVYQNLELQAKTDKRGIWSFPDLKPSWVIQTEIEAEKEEKRRLEMMAENSREAAERQKKREQAVANTNVQMWAEIPDNFKTGAYQVRYDKYTDITQYLTPLMPLSIKNPQLKSTISLGVSHAFYGQDVKKAKGHSYFLTFKYYGLLTAFSYSTDLRLITENSRIHLTNPKYEWDIPGAKDEDTDMYYRTEFARFMMTENQFKDFIAGNQVEFRIGNLEGVISSSQLNFIRNIP